MRHASNIALVLMLLTSTVASAQSCGDLGTQAEMNQCAAADHAKVDRELNAVYDAYRARLNDEQKRQLRDAQLAWIRFRDLACAFESSGVKGGSVYSLILQSCLERMTRTRIGQLSALAACKEGDLSCPGSK